ncbi:MAG TPA: DciA family protein [Noviherbaspirillum sp.]
MRSPSFLSYQAGARSARGAVRATQGVADFLHANDKLAALLPAVTRIAALQKDCASILPALFETCSVMHFEAGQLVLATPNAAVATKLKQQLPKLQDNLLKRGWQVNVIRLKVQLRKVALKPQYQKQLELPKQAMSALAELRDSLENSPQNAALKTALSAMLKRHCKEE